MSLPPLPIDAILPELRARIREGNLALVAPTGAGKTTRVPPAMLTLVPTRARVVLIEPRRLAARAAAARMADEHGEPIGRTFGYRVRFESRVSARTRVEVMTEGLFLRRLQSDPFLEGIGAVIFDEFHERNIDADLGLAMARRVQREVREDLRLIVMSATLAAESVASFLGDAPILRSEGRLHPVTAEYWEPPTRLRSSERVREACVRALTRSDGDLLVFLPGVGEIRDARRALEDVPGVELVELYGDLTLEDQNRALLRGNRRRVVLATNVAESSVTVEGITGVVDLGEVKRLRLDPGSGLNRLERDRISASSATQRAGRAGRERPGHCLRLWSERAQSALRPFDEPEIERVELTSAVLQLRAWGEREPSQFPWYQRPSDDALTRADTVLRDLGALDRRGLTPRGERLATLPVEPRLGRLILAAEDVGHRRRLCQAAALISERDILERDTSVPPGQESDVAWRLDRLADVGHRQRPRGVVISRARRVLQVARDLEQRTETVDEGPAKPLAEALGRALLAAFPDRLVKARERDPERGRMVGGRGVRLSGSSGIRGAELFVALDLDDGGSEGRVRIASAIDHSWLPVEDICKDRDVRFDTTSESVVVEHRRCYRDLPLDVNPSAPTPEDRPRVTEVLAAAAAENLERALQLSGPGLRTLLDRWELARRWLPDLGLQEWTDEHWRARLPELCAGRRSFAELRRAPLAELLLGELDYSTRSQFDRDVPLGYRIPTGREVSLEYRPRAEPPILAARIQELFGLSQSPTIARGRVRILFHLLAPNGRPQQVTDDLESFWANTYPQVRKDLRGRYPKHAWPEDPHQATPESKPRRRRPRD